MIAQDLWQAHYQIVSIIFLKKFMKLNVDMDTIRKNVKDAELDIKIVSAFLNTQYTFFKDDLIEYKCLCCHKNYQQKFDKKLKEPFFNTYNFSNHNSDKFILLLQKRVYPYEYMDD